MIIIIIITFMIIWSTRLPTDSPSKSRRPAAWSPWPHNPLGQWPSGDILARHGTPRFERCFQEENRPTQRRIGRRGYRRARSCAGRTAACRLLTDCLRPCPKAQLGFYAVYAAAGEMGTQGCPNLMWRLLAAPTSPCYSFDAGAAGQELL